LDVGGSGWLFWVVEREMEVEAGKALEVKVGEALEVVVA